MADTGGIPLPQNVAEVEQLVKRLYMPGSASLIPQINDQLQRLQLSQDGWKLADELMASDDANVRFFAALTFTVKLNNDGHSLDAESAQTVQMRLIYWLVRLVRQGDASIACKKLCSTLTTYFVRSPVPWNQPLLHLSLSFQHGDAVRESEVESSEAALPDLLPSLTSQQVVVLLWLAGNLAEEVGRVDVNTPAYARLYAQMQNIVEDASALMKWSFGQPAVTTASSAQAEALRTFLTWIDYAQPIWPQNGEALDHLRGLIGPAAQCLLNEELLREALDVFRDILESYTSFFQPRHLEVLARIIYNDVRPKLLEALSDQDPDCLLFGQLVIAFGCANVVQVVGDPSQEFASKAIVKLHLDILAADGYPGDEDQLSIQSIEFWNTYIEYVNETLFAKDPDDAEPAWLPQTKYVLSQTIELLWKKMWTPPSDVVKGWSDTEREGFKEFRLDATDYMLSVFLLLGKDMLQQLVTLTLGSLEAQQWRAVEAALFCLNSLADNVLEDPPCEEIVGEIFRSSLFREIADFSKDIPPKARRTAIDVLGSYGEYVERHAEFLPDTLRFLFASLEMAGFANAAAKSIAELCCTCRASLTNELDAFLAQYQRFLNSETSDPYTKEKVIGAIAAIIQARTPESAKAQPLVALISNVERDIAAAKQHAAAGEVDMAEVMGVTALECLASIGKGMQVPDDVPIDIYDDDEVEITSEKATFWGSQDGQMVQQRIVGCFSVLQVVGNYSAAIDAACQVLRSGFAETEPGPFVLPPSVTVSFLQQCSIQTPQLESVLSMACTLITQHSRKDSKRIDEEVAAIYECVHGFAEALGKSHNDPPVAAGCIDILIKMMTSYSHLLFGKMATSTLDFTLTAIEAPDSQPKRSACDFWTKIIKPSTAPISALVEQQINEAVVTYGPKFAKSLMFQIGGEAMRSDVDFLCEPLKAFLLHRAGAQTWLQHALSLDTFPSPHVSMQDRVRFFRQLCAAGSDGKKTKELAKAFWAVCRGTVVSY